MTPQRLAKSSWDVPVFSNHVFRSMSDIYQHSSYLSTTGLLGSASRGSDNSKMMNRHLNAADRDAADRLRRIWNAKKGELRLTQERAAAVFGRTQSLISAYLVGRAALGPVAVLKFAHLLQVKPTDIRPDFAFSLVPGDIPQDVIELAIKVAALPPDVRQDIAATVELLGKSSYAALLTRFKREKEAT